MIEQGIHIIQGSLGDGKTLRSIQIAEWFINNNRRVATNINIRLERLCKPDYYPSLVTRIPDKPSIQVLEHLGEGSSKKGEYGLLLLDELAIWMNSRTFQDKDRAKIIRFLIEARKRRWIVIFIAQKAQMIDKQARDLGATVHTCRSSKNILLLKWLPRFHFVNVSNTLRMKASGTDFYKSKRLYGTYDTEQRFCDNYGGNPGEDQYFITEHPSRLDRYYASKNGYYSLLPPRILPSGYNRRAARIRDIDAKDVRRIGLITAALLTTIAFLIFSILPFSSPPIAESPLVAEESTGSADPVINLAPARSYSNNQKPYRDLRIRHFSRIGDNFTYHFQDHNGQLVSSKTLEIEGYRVENRGPDEALVVAPDYEYWSLYR